MLIREDLMKKHFGTDDCDEVKRLWFEDMELGNEPSEEGVTKMTFPYYAPDDSLPPIPTPKEIEEAGYLACNQAAKRDFGPTAVFRVKDVYAVKMGFYKEFLQEAENLIFLEKHAVKTPRVYAAFRANCREADPLDKLKRPRKVPREFITSYLVMPWIEGITLNEEIFKYLGIHARTKIYQKLAEQLSLLRSIPPPNPSYYGRVNEQSFRRHVDFVKYRYRNRPGPFYTYEAFLQQMYNTFEVKIINRINSPHSLEKADRWTGGIPPAMQLMASAILSGFTSAEAGAPKLTHFDIKLDNIMLVPPKSGPVPDISRGPPEDIGDYELFLIDWESMCWLPGWAEAAGAMFRLPHFSYDEYLGWYEVFKGMEPCYLPEANWYCELCSHMGGVL